MVPRENFEISTYRLSTGCSAFELPRVKVAERVRFELTGVFKRL